MGAVLVLLGACGSAGERADDGSTTDAGAPEFAPSLAPNPNMGPAGMAAMHGDSGSSDTSPLSGPGLGPVAVERIDLGAVCSVIAIGSDGLPVALCTRIADVSPVVHLLDPSTGESAASLEVAAGALLGGVYGYLDDEDRMVMVDGNSNLLRIAHRTEGSDWLLEVDERTSLVGSVPAGESVTSVSPDYSEGVWFATDGATVGLVDTTSGEVTTLSLGAGERVSNSISTAPAGMAVATTHALYLVSRAPSGTLEVAWRVPYDRGPSRKPGQLSWGTGSTPTFFGPTDGADYVALVDNADPVVHLQVIGVAGAGAGDVVCSTAVLGEAGLGETGSGSENSPIGAGRTVVVAGTYGYPYPRLPADAGPSTPETAEFVGGMTRVDVREDASGCDVVWESGVRSAAVPKLSIEDGTITTMTRPGTSLQDAGGVVAYTVIDADTGRVLSEQDLGAPGDPVQLAGTTAPDGVYYQGTLGEVLRITPG